MIGRLNLRHEAVADKKFQEQLGNAVDQDNAVVTIKAYEPNHLVYDVQSDKGGVVVFSEIYYPGWTATIDGQPAELEASVSRSGISLMTRNDTKGTLLI